MIKYPIEFFGAATATPGMMENWDTSSSENKFKCAVPKEFEGGGDGPSPEDFFLLALQNCFLATLKVYAHYSKLSFDSVQIKSVLVVDLDGEKKPCMKEVKLLIKMINPSDLKKADLLVKKTLSNGFILQSVKTIVTAEVEYQ